MPDTCCTCHARTVDEPALAFDLRVASLALTQRDYSHARYHVSAALGRAPTDARTLAAVEALAEKVDVTAVPEKPWYGDVALAAFAIYRAGDRPKAVQLLAQVAELMPHLGYEHALTNWIAASDEPLGPPAEGQVGRLLARAARETVGLHRLRPGERALLASYATLAEAFGRTRPGGPQMTMVSGMLRRAGRLDAALAAARAVEGLNGHIQEGLALRTAGEGAAAGRAFEAAVRLDADTAHAVERARCHFVAGEPAHALTLLAGLPDDGDPEVHGLRALCEGPAPADPVGELDALRRRVHLRVRVAPPKDATANLLDDPKLREVSDLRASVRGWESPTNRLLLAVLAGHADVTRVEYSITFEDAPRPVLASVRGGRPLWVVRGGVVVQAVPAPPDDLRRALAEAAAGGGDFDGIWVRAAACVAEWPVERAPELLAALVHPPPEVGAGGVPAGVYRYQVACACAIAALPSAVALPLLEAVIFGPVDWASAAAIVALGERVRRDPAGALEGRRLLIDAVDDLLAFSTEPRCDALWSALEHLPGVPPSTLEALRAWYREHFPEDDGPAQPPPGTTAPPGSQGQPTSTAPASPASTAPGRAGSDAPTGRLFAVGAVAVGILLIWVFVA